MLKLENIRENSLDKFRDAVIQYAYSDLPIENLNAVLFGTKYKIKDEQFIEALKKMKDSEVTFFGTPLKSYVIAALDVLNIEKYLGKDKFILELIQSGFQNI